MKNIFLSILALGFLVVSCNSDDDSAPISPSTFPSAVVNYSGPATVNENVGTVGVDVTLNKAVDNGTAFTITQVGGDAVEGEDFSLSNLTIPSFGKTGVLNVNIIDNPFPKPDRTLVLEVGTPEFVGELLNPNSNLPYTVSLTIKDVNPTDGVTVGFDWNEDQASDLDLTLFYDDGSGDAVEVAIQATGDVPEIGMSLILNSDPDGTYYVDMQPFDFSELQIDYNFGIAKPSGDVVEFTGVFDFTNLASYGSDESGALGATAYRLVKIVKSGSNYTITQL